MLYEKTTCVSRHCASKDAPFEAQIECVTALRRDALTELITTLRAISVSDTNVNFGSVIAHAQKLLVLDVEELARTLQVSCSTVRRWIGGLASPHITVRRAICQTLIDAAGVKLRLLAQL